MNYLKFVKQKKYISTNKGVTLIELIVGVAIVAVLATLGSSFFTFGNKSFVTGKSESSAMTQVRVAANAITVQIRLAKSMQIITNLTESYPFSDGNYYIYKDTDNNIVMRHNGVTSTLVAAPANGTGTFVFSKAGVNLVNLDVTFDVSGHTFNIAPDIQIMNLGTSSVVGITGNGLCFTKNTASTSAVSPTPIPTGTPVNTPTNVPTNSPTHAPTNAPTNTPTRAPTNTPTNSPTNTPTRAPTNTPTKVPSPTPKHPK
jgi:prepilin-type N-terminal cleavage/methylation domain-containing protein